VDVSRLQDSPKRRAQARRPASGTYRPRVSTASGRLALIAAHLQAKKLSLTGIPLPHGPGDTLTRPPIWRLLRATHENMRPASLPTS